jgi:hypothetical protein
MKNTADHIKQYQRKWPALGQMAPELLNVAGYLL